MVLHTILYRASIKNKSIFNDLFVNFLFRLEKFAFFIDRIPF